MLRTKNPHKNACIWVESRQMTFHTYVLKVYINIQRKKKNHQNQRHYTFNINISIWVEFGPQKTDLSCHFLLKGSETPVPSQESAGLTLEGIWAKKSPCEGWLRFLVGQKQSSSRLVILKSRSMSPPAYFLHLSFMKMSITCTCLLKSIVFVIKYFESDFLGK